MIVSWNSTNQCNMYCDHCYRDAGDRRHRELNTVEAKQLMDELVVAGFKIMIFSGGEPLMRPDILELVKYATAVGLRPVFGTNGTLITRTLAEELQDAGTMGMGISLDSMDKQKHDTFRQYASAWDQAVRGMEHCRSAGLPFQIHTTVMGWNDHELEAITDFAVSMGARAHHIFFMVPTGRAASIQESATRAQEYEEIIRRILAKQQTVDIELKPTCAPQFMRIAKEMGIETRFRRGCLSGISYCIIGPEGDVQPCAYLDIPLGNVRDMAFSELWREHPVLKQLRSLSYEGSCGRCEYNRICGGCRARAAFYHNGNIMAEEPWCLYGSSL